MAPHGIHGNAQGRPWVRLVVLGQSFMLHQIRKMVGGAVAVCRGVCSHADLQRALRSAAPVPTPMAPELGLFLDECVFDSYNARWAAGGHAAVALAGAVGAAAEAFKVLADRCMLSSCRAGMVASAEPGFWVFARSVASPA